MAEGLLLVGCGKMGAALLAGWVAAGTAPRPIFVVEPKPAVGAVPADSAVTCVASADALPQGFHPSVVVLATKPQVMDEVVPAYRRFAGAGTAFVSIAAGRTIAYFEKHLGTGAAVVRSMPNTPAMVGRGITVCCANAGIDARQRAVADQLMAAVGEVGWVEDEALIDAVTAVSGSGPAYAFLLAECMAEAGRQAGLPAELSDRLARATVAGAGELLHRSPESAAQLRQNVTSPNGTTFAALQVLMAADGMQPLLSRAIAAAAKRSRELAG
jgi:pyrroline-5-carboxylate reductase